LYAGTFGKVAGLFGVMAFMRLIMLAETLYGATLQHHIEDHRRATIGSLASFGGEVLSFCLLGVSSLLFAHSGNTATYRMLALGFAVIGVTLVILGNKKHLHTERVTADDAPAVPGRPV
jgi:uncharacterized membrane protein